MTTNLSTNTQIKNRRRLHEETSRILKNQYHFALSKDNDIIIWPKGAEPPKDFAKHYWQPGSWEVAEMVITDYKQAKPGLTHAPTPRRIIRFLLDA